MLKSDNLLKNNRLQMFCEMVENVERIDFRGVYLLFYKFQKGVTKRRDLKKMLPTFVSSSRLQNIIYKLFNAVFKSLIISSNFSTPTESRIPPGSIPFLICSSGGIAACVIELGCSTSVRIIPKLTAKVME